MTYRCTIESDLNFDEVKSKEGFETYEEAERWGIDNCIYPEDTYTIEKEN